MKNIAKRIRIEAGELDRMVVDLPEIDIHADLEFQANRLRLTRLFYWR